MWKTAGLVVGALVVGLALVELVLRTFVAPHVAAQAATRFELDPDLIYRLRPRNRVTWHDGAMRDMWLSKTERT
jgi:hypothetical protein